ncbi:pre-60S factor REI1 [Schistosoma japonicum]|nr:pre-60S factor REI1 [Schistosoma japonicum]
MMYICSSCKANVSVTEKVNHVKSDWHIYNLKRVVSGLLPISEDIFVHKKQLFDTESPAIEKETYCRACKKSFSNSKSFSAHLISKRHLHNSQFSQEKISTQSAITCTESAEENCTTQSIPLGSCLFCDRHISLGPVTNNSLDDAQKRDLAKRVLNHMLDAHNFTVPFPEKLIDPAGLLVELGRIVGEERSCLACGRQFYGSHLERSENIRISLSAVRSHMLDKPGHKQVWYGIEDPVQLALLMAETEHESDGHDKRNFPKAALAGGELFSQFYDQSVVAAPFILSDDEDVYEVRLPSGTVLGHRKMRTFYKQHLSTNLQLAPFNKAKLSSCGSGQKCVSILHSDLNTTIQKGFNRDPRRYLNEQKKYWDLINGVQGNLCNRLHLRRQY